MATLGPEIFARGFRFTPSPLEAATYYLPRLIAGAPLHEAVRPVIHRADVYACEPGELARLFCPLPRTGHRFFFTTCKLQPHRAGKASRAVRAAGPGSWQSLGATDIVDHAKVKVGEIKKMRYKKGRENTDWLMDEYSCCLEDAVVGDRRQYVLCNIYVSPRAPPGSAARHESAAFFAQPAPAPVPIMQAAAPKRPAPQSAEPPCPKRMRGAVAPKPPVVQPAGGTSSTSFPPPRPFTPSVTRSSPASAQAPAPVPTRLAAPPIRTPAPAPPRPLAQQLPLLTPPVLRACHVPVQAQALHCRPQPSVQTKHPFDAAELRDEAEESPVADEDDDDLARLIEETVATAEAEEESAANSEGSMMTDDEMDQHIFSLLDDAILVVPKEETPDTVA